jgi:cellulose synthase/poly-beta-1,6-N-acetylglucosamine synthase-like glycosyltransferase
MQQRTMMLLHRGYVVKPTVSIIIPARNEETVIKKTISSCLAQTYGNVEVIVVCHNCSDGTFASASKFEDKRVRPFEFNTKEAGKGIALNFGVEQSKGEYLLVVDSDGILAKDFIANALPLFAKDFVAIQGKIMASNAGYNLVAKLAALEGYLFSTPFMGIRGLLDKRTPLGGTGCLFRKDKLLEVGGFRNALIDDFELSFRFFRHKYRIAYAPLSIIYDEKPPKLTLLMRQRARWTKGHFDLLKERIPEWTDPIGIIYWLNPIFMLAGLTAIGISSFAVAHFILLGIFPYTFSFTPITLWLAMTATSFVVQTLVLIRDFKLQGLKYVGHSLLLVVFAHYWYVTLIKSFFVKSWANTKTTHGFVSAKDMEKVVVEESAIVKEK